MSSKQPSTHTGFFVPWKTDASMFFGAAEDSSSDVRGDREKLKNLQLISPPALRDFEANGTLVVAGDRGTGKSLILAKKAAQRLVKSSAEKAKYLTLVDRPPFVSLLLPNSISISSKDYRRFGSAKVWSRIWVIVLKAHFACLSIRERNDPQTREANYVLRHYFHLDDESSNTTLRELLTTIWTSFNVQETIGLSLKFLVHRSPSQEDLESWSNLTSAAIGRAAEGAWQQAIFVDGIDEAMGDPMGESLFNKIRLNSVDQPPSTNIPDKSISTSKEWEIHAGTRALALDVILHSQTGFVLAADEIRTEFRSLKCYGAVRHEAAAWILDPTKTGKLAAKIQGTLVTLIEYQKEQLNAIFSLNVDHSDQQEELAVPGDENHSKRLYGFQGIRHSSVLGSDGIEEMRDLLIRHTFGVPRQLVSIAKATLDAVPYPAQRRDRIDDIVNAVDKYAATTLWADYISSVNPPWFDERTEGIFEIDKNVFDQEKIKEIENSYPGLLSFLYSRGMLGKPIGKPGSTILEFHKANGVESKLPLNCEYIVVHPVLSAFLCHSKSPTQRHDYYVSDFIVGQSMRCPRKFVKPIIRLIYEGDAKWTFEVKGRRIDFGSLVGPGENPLLTEIESTRAAIFLFIIVALAMKRHQVEWASVDQLEEECNHVNDAIGQSLTIHGRSISDYAGTRLRKSGELEETHTINNVLREYGIGISASTGETTTIENAHCADATSNLKNKARPSSKTPAKKFSLRQASADRAAGPKSNWPVIPPAMIAIRMVQPRTPIDY